MSLDGNIVNEIKYLVEGCETEPPINYDVITRFQTESRGHYSPMKNASILVWNSVPMILFIVGMLGNILTVVIIARQRRMTSTTVYLLALAISDMLLLCNAPLRQWIRYIEMDWRHWSDLVCKMSLYITYSSQHMSSWILVAVTMERVVSVIFPQWIMVGSTSKSSMIVILILVVTVFGLNSHYLYGYGVTKTANFTEAYCEVKYENYYQFAYKIWPWIDFAVTFMIPFVFLVTGNALIICRLKRARLQRRRLSVIETSAIRSHENDAKVLTLTLVLLAVVFFICLTPIQIYLIVAPYRLAHIDTLRCKDLIEWRDAIEVDDLWYAITNNLGYLNASFNFVLYVISGSKFRDEIKALFLCKKAGGKVVFGTHSPGSNITTNTTIPQLLQHP